MTPKVNQLLATTSPEPQLFLGTDRGNNYKVSTLMDPISRGTDKACLKGRENNRGI